VTQLCLQHQGYDYVINNGQLQIQRAGAILAQFSLAPLIEGKATELGTWQEIDEAHLCAELNRGGTVHLAIRDGYVCYWMETDQERLESLTYFPTSAATGNDWHTYVSDEHDRRWDIALDAEVLISSAYPGMNVDDADGHGMTDPGDMPPTWIWNIPVRALSFLTDDGDWLGLSVPGALPVGVTRLKMAQQQFSMTFQVVQASCEEWQLPQVYFAPGLCGPYDVLDSHRAISQTRGWMVEKDPDHPEWWTYPYFKCWDEMLRQQGGPFTYDEEGNPSTILTTENWLAWIEEVAASTGLEGHINAVIDQYWSYRYGSKVVIDELGGVEGLRQTIDSLRERGTRVGLYLHQYMVDKSVPFYQEHPECFCEPIDPDFQLRHGVQVGANPSLAYIDWTHPGGRQYMLDMIEFMLSDAEGCLNADWLLLHNTLAPDPRLYHFHDPSWGIGDLMQYKALRECYQQAKRIKPDALVRRQSPAEPCFQPYYDQVNLCEHWKPQMTDCYKRGRIATRLLRDVFFTTDAWFVTRTKGYEYYMNMAVWNAPEIESVNHAIHPYMHHVPLTEKDYHRRYAGLQVYMNAPVNISDRCQVEWECDELRASRRYTRGPLSGFYAALALSPRCLVTYSPNQALIAATEARRARVPLPPQARVISVQQVLHSGDERPHDYQIVPTDEGQELNTQVPDSASDIAYLRVRYELNP